MKKVFILILLPVLLFFAGCKTQTLVAHQNTTEKNVSDNQRITFRTDTVFEQYFDTVKITQHGDTIFQTETKYRYKYLFISRLDTIIKNDTVFREFDKSSVQVTEKPSKKYVGWLILLVTAILIPPFIWFIKKFT